jgi:hypothetical protein
VEPGANSSRAQGCRCEHEVRAQAEGESGVVIAVETRVWARTGVTSGAGLNKHGLERGQAHVATGAGV